MCSVFKRAYGHVWFNMHRASRKRNWEAGVRMRGKYVLSVPSIDAFESMNVQAPVQKKSVITLPALWKRWC